MYDVEKDIQWPSSPEHAQRTCFLVAETICLYTAVVFNFQCAFCHVNKDYLPTYLTEFSTIVQCFAAVLLKFNF